MLGRSKFGGLPFEFRLLVVLFLNLAGSTRLYVGGQKSNVFPGLLDALKKEIGNVENSNSGEPTPPTPQIPPPITPSPNVEPTIAPPTPPPWAQPPTPPNTYPTASEATMSAPTTTVPTTKPTTKRTTTRMARTTTMKPPTTHPSQSTECHYMGCYADDYTRLLDRYYVLYNNSHENCQRMCRQNGSRYAGVQYQTYCFCGDILHLGLVAKKVDEYYNYRCEQYYCPSNRQQTCGGSWASKMWLLQSPCPEDWHYFNESKKCFKIIDDHLTINQAADRCRADNSSLASIHSPAENVFVTSLIPQYDTYSFYIGAEKTLNGWTWTDGSKMNFTNSLSPRSPKEKYIAICMNRHIVEDVDDLVVKNPNFKSCANGNWEAVSGDGAEDGLYNGGAVCQKDAVFEYTTSHK